MINALGVWTAKPACSEMAHQELEKTQVRSNEVAGSNLFLGKGLFVGGSKFFLHVKGVLMTAGLQLTFVAKSVDLPQSRAECTITISD